MTPSLGARVLAAAALCTSLATLIADDTTPPLQRRTLVSDVSMPPIDRGMRDMDAVREARTSDVEIVDRTAARRLGYVPGSMIVKFRPGTAAAAASALLAMVGGAPLPEDAHANFDLVAIDDAADPEAAARRLSAQPDVEYAQARYLVRPRFTPNDPFFRQQWNLSLLNMERAWDINPGASTSIVVAVLDSGVAFRSATVNYRGAPFVFEGRLFAALGNITVPFAMAPDLGPADRFVSPRDFIWNDSLPLDLDGHGTHITGTVAQATNNAVGVAGMAFNVRIMPVKVISTLWDDIFDSPFASTDDVIARGVRYAVDNGAKVLNMSIGREGAPSPVMQDALAYAVSRGAFVALAGGNDFLTGNRVQRPVDVAPQIEGVVGVGAVTIDRQRAAYSSVGPWIDVMAPGGDNRGGIIQQTYDLDLVETYIFGPSRFGPPRFDSFAYYGFSGTSSAAPHVAGFAAMLMQQGITSPAAIEAAMKRYAVDLGPQGRDDQYGHGLIEPRTTLRGMGLAR